MDASSRPAPALSLIISIFFDNQDYNIPFQQSIFSQFSFFNNIEKIVVITNYQS